MINIDAFAGEEHQPFRLEGANGCAALLVHGFPGSAKEMRPVADLLHTQGWTAHGILLPGFGPDIKTLGTRSADEWLGAVEGATTDLRANHDTILLVGNSMGGGLSIQAAARSGADGLVLFAPFWKINNFLWTALPVLRYVIPKFKPFSIFKPDFNDPDFQQGTRNFMPNADFDDPEFQRQTLELEVDTRIFANIRAVGARGYDLAAAVHAPSLIIQGDTDDLVTPENTARLRDRLQGDVSYLEVAANHNPLDPTADYWPEVVAAIEQFTANLTNH
jgi:esterase/lipase